MGVTTKELNLETYPTVGDVLKFLEDEDILVSDYICVGRFGGVPHGESAHRGPGRLKIEVWRADGN